jgi:hypothetical protein
MTGPIADLLRGSTPVPSALSGMAVTGGAMPDYGVCPRCGTNRLTRPNATRCEQCAATAPGGSLHGFAPSQPPAERDPQRQVAREREIAAARADFERDVVELRGAIVRVEQRLRDVRVHAQRIGALEQLQSGRAAESTRDALLAATRQEVTEAAHRIERDAWSV